MQKGIDPREFTLAGFGGAGPLHAAEVAAMLDMKAVLIPAHTGITRRWGSDRRPGIPRAANGLRGQGVAETGPAQSLYDDMERKLGVIFERDRVPSEKVRMLRQADLRYVGQGYELKIDVPDGALTMLRWTASGRPSTTRHRAEYGHAFEASPIEIVTVKVRGLGLVDKLTSPPAHTGASKPKRHRIRAMRIPRRRRSPDLRHAAYRAHLASRGSAAGRPGDPPADRHDHGCAARLDLLGRRHGNVRMTRETNA